MTVREEQFTSSFVQDPTRSKFWERFLQTRLKTNEDFQYVGLGDLLSKRFQKAEKGSVEEVPFEGAPRLVFVNGYFSEELSSLSQLPKSCLVMPLSKALKSYSALLNNRLNRLLKEENDPFALLNASVHQEGAFLYLAPKCRLEAPIQIVSIINTQPDTWLMPRLHLFVGKDVEASFVMSSHCLAGTSYLHNVVCDVEIEENCKVNFLQENVEEDAFRFTAFRATLKRNSHLQVIDLASSHRSRSSWHVSLAGEGAEVDLSGIWFLNGQKQAHTNVVVEHLEPHTRSMQLFKGILDGSSVSSFQGKILVRRKAQKTMAYQLNKNLLLSDKAQANSKPNLEIFADDVKASHGATVGQLDSEQLFYLRTRGLSPVLCKTLLIRGFCQEVLSKISDTQVRLRLERHLGKFCEEIDVRT